MFATDGSPLFSSCTFSSFEDPDGYLKRLAGIFNPPWQKEYCRQEVYERRPFELWVLEECCLRDEDFELRWTNCNPLNPDEDGQSRVYILDRRRVYGNAVYFLESLRATNTHVTERWACRGWLCLPRRFFIRKQVDASVNVFFFSAGSSV